MVHAMSIFWAMLLLSAAASAQSSTATGTSVSEPATTTAESPSAITSTSETSTDNDVPMSLWSAANSLITHYYPSTTVTGIRTLTWPSTVVLDSTTYTVHPGTTTLSGGPSSITSTGDARPTGTQAKATKESKNQMSDKKIAIIIGVVIGVLTFAVMGVVFFCLFRRRKDTGSFFMRRSTSTRSRFSGSWTASGSRGPNNFGNTSYVTAGPMAQREPRYIQAPTIERGNTPPLTEPLAAGLHHNSRSTSDENPFYTPEERLDHHELDSRPVQHHELEHDGPSQRRSSTSMRDSRPPTPFSPLMMMQMPGPGAKPQVHQNPFASPEDREADDVVSPILPSHSPRPDRRFSPMVHYPSWDEVSEFNFSSDGRTQSSEDGGDGWRPGRERRDGRYELA